MKLPLEDNFADILSKARRGLGPDVEDAAAQAGLSTMAANSVLGGNFDESAPLGVGRRLRLLAPDPRRGLAGRGEYAPEEIPLSRGALSVQYALRGHDGEFLPVWDPATSGRPSPSIPVRDCSGMLEDIKEHGLTVRLILLTHSHGDHYSGTRPAGGKDRARRPTSAIRSLSKGRKPSRRARPSPQAASKSRPAPPGAIPGRDYLRRRGSSRTVAIVGDAIFAGSMGGGNISYQDALKTNRENILSCPTKPSPSALPRPRSPQWASRRK